jgi:predicted HTH transcriptional regulator
MADQIQKQYNIQTDHSEYDIFLPNLYAFKHNQQADTSLPLAGKTVETLSKKALKKLFAQERVKKHFQIHKVTTRTEADQKLKALNLMSNGLVLKGTFLCLASVEQIRSVSSNAHTSKFFTFDDTEGLRTGITEFVQGNLVEQFEQMIAHIKQNLYLVRDIDSRTEDYQVPEKVFTELLANAFVHRTYANEALYQTKVELYPDRLEIYNAGKFADEIALDKIGEIDNSVVINPEIVQLFFLHSLVETAAKGIRRSQEILRSRQMKPAVFEQKNGYVRVTIWKNKRANSANAAHALSLIDEGRIADFFDWAEQQRPDPTVALLKSEFILGKTGFDFNERLKLLAKTFLS